MRNILHCRKAPYVLINCVCAFIILLMGACGNSDLREENTYWPNGQMKEQWFMSRINDSTWIRSGQYTAWYESGNTQIAGQFADDRRAGYWTWYFDRKEPVKMIYGGYRDGEMDGDWTFWMLPHDMSAMKNSMDGSHGQNGHDMSQMSSGKDGDLDFDPNELSPNRVETYRLGKPEGVWMSWFPDGSLADSAFYVNGKLSGARVSYHENGRKASQSTYDNGVMVEDLQMWDTAGQPIQMQSE